MRTEFINMVVHYSSFFRGGMIFYYSLFFVRNKYWLMNFVMNPSRIELVKWSHDFEEFLSAHWTVVASSNPPVINTIKTKLVSTAIKWWELDHSNSRQTNAAFKLRVTIWNHFFNLKKLRNYNFFSYIIDISMHGLLSLVGISRIIFEFLVLLFREGNYLFLFSWNGSVFLLEQLSEFLLVHALHS